MKTKPMLHMHTSMYVRIPDDILHPLVSFPVSVQARKGRKVNDHG